MTGEQTTITVEVPSQWDGVIDFLNNEVTLGEVLFLILLGSSLLGIQRLVVWWFRRRLNR